MLSSITDTRRHAPRESRSVRTDEQEVSAKGQTTGQHRAEDTSSGRGLEAFIDKAPTSPPTHRRATETTVRKADGGTLVEAESREHQWDCPRELDPDQSLAAV